MGAVEASKKATKSEDKQVAAATKSKTKRQRRKDLQKNSDKNKWLIQHPKIQSMDRREQIYIKDAGLNETKAEKRQAPIDPKLDLMSPEVKFGRILAGTDQRKRHAAVKKLKAYLKARCDIAEVIDGEGSGDENSGGISELDLLKLWKALWFTLYMADKRPVQDELSKHICKLLWCVVGTEEEDECAGRAYLEMTEAEEQELEEEDDEYDVTLEEIENTLEDGKPSDDDDASDNDDDDSKDSENKTEDEEGNEALSEEDEEESDIMMEMDDSEIPHCRGAHLVSLFVRTFFRTIRRDWGSMDKYRIDKFYTLIRLMMHEIYEYMSVRSWNYGIVLLLNDAIFAEILRQPPNGLRYHLIDLCLEELAKVNAKAKIPLTEATFLDVLEPFFGLSQTGRHDDTVQERVMEKVLDKFLEEYSVVSENALKEDEEEGEDKDKVTSLIFKDVHVKTIGEFLFTLGSDPDTKDKYRKSLYDLHKKYMRRLKKIGKDVIIETDEDGNEVYDDEEEGVDDVNLNNIDESIKFLESETNEELSEEPEEELGNGDIEAPDEELSVEPKKESKKKKKKRKSMEQQELDPEPELTQNVNETNVDNKRKKKKKKKSDPVEADADEEVVITLTEQQDAKKKDRNAKKKLKEQKEAEEEARAESAKHQDGSKHVSFGKKNRAKSHKASMKALRTSSPPSTKETVPEKSILRKVPKHSSPNPSGKVSLKKKRKKAISYF